MISDAQYRTSDEADPSGEEEEEVEGPPKRRAHARGDQKENRQEKWLTFCTFSAHPSTQHPGRAAAVVPRGSEPVAQLWDPRHRGETAWLPKRDSKRQAKQRWWRGSRDRAASSDRSIKGSNEGKKRQKKTTATETRPFVPAGSSRKEYLNLLNNAEVAESKST